MKYRLQSNYGFGDMQVVSVFVEEVPTVDGAVDDLTGVVGHTYIIDLSLQNGEHHKI